MAQTNYTPISLYYSTTASAVPTAANLVPGELAINTNDGKLYYEDSSGVVQVLATKSTGSIGGSNTQVQFNNSGSLGGSSSFTWDGTTVTATKFAGALNGTVGATTASTGAFTTLSTSSTTTFSGLTASTALALDASKNVVSVTNTGTGNNVLSASPTLTGTIAGASLSLSSLTSGRVTYATTSGLLTDSANLTYGTGLSVNGISQVYQTGLYTTDGTLSNYSVNNGVYLNGNATGWSQLSGDGTRSSFVRVWGSGASPADFIVFNTASSERMRISSTGNVGIGTSSPGSKLTVASGGIGLSKTYSLLWADSNDEIRVDDNPTWYTAAANVMTFKTYDGPFIFQNSNGPVTKMIIDPTGRLGLGVTPNTWYSSNYKTLQIGTGSLFSQTDGSDIRLSSNAYLTTGGAWTYINGTADYATSYEQTGGEHRFFKAPSGTGAITFTQAMTLDASGNLLVGTTSGTSAQLRVHTAQSSMAYMQNSIASPNGLQLYYSNATPPNSVANEFLYCNDTGATRMTVRSNGGIANYSANNVNLSDSREKTNFAPSKSYLDVICSIPVQTFNYIDQNLETDAGLTLGVVAQDVQAVAPELVMESNWANKDAEPKMRLSIYQTDLQYALMKCIQEQQALIESLTTRLTALEN